MHKSTISLPFFPFPFLPFEADVAKDEEVAVGMNKSTISLPFFPFPFLPFEADVAKDEEVAVGMNKSTISLPFFPFLLLRADVAKDEESSKGGGNKSCWFYKCVWLSGLVDKLTSFEYSQGRLLPVRSNSTSTLATFKGLTTPRPSAS